MDIEQKPDDLFGMNLANAMEYIHAHLATLKLLEKKLSSLETEQEKWTNRLHLAQQKKISDLITAAETEIEKTKNEYERITEEITILKAEVEKMRSQIPNIASKERTIDPDLLQQELIIANGKLPENDTDEILKYELAHLEEESAIEAALERLKHKK